MACVALHPWPLMLMGQLCIFIGTVIIAGGIPPWWKVLLTYIVPYLVSTYGAVSAMLRAEEDANDIEETATGEENAEVKVEVSIQDGAIPVLERWNPPATCQSPQGKWIKSTFLKNYEGAEGNTIPAVDTKLAQVNIKE